MEQTVIEQLTAIRRQLATEMDQEKRIALQREIDRLITRGQRAWSGYAHGYHLASYRRMDETQKQQLQQEYRDVGIVDENGDFLTDEAKKLYHSHREV